MPDIEAIISRVYDQATQSLRISGGVGGGGEAGPWLNIQRNNVEIVPLANNIDFSTDFTVTQSPVGDGNIGIGTTIARQADLDALTQADLPYDTTNFDNNLDPGTILTGQDLAEWLDGIDLSGGTLNPVDFDGNLPDTIVTVQQFADFFDDFTFPEGTVLTVNSVGPDGLGDIFLTAADVSAIGTDQLGVASGVATLDALGILDLAQWPQFVTDINGYNGGSVALLASDIGTDTTDFTGNLSGADTTIQAALQTFNDFTPTASADGHEIRDTGGAFTFRTGLKFSDYFTITDDLANDETDVDIDLTELGTALGTGGAVAPFDATYLTTTANGSLSNEVVVGATPGGELGGTWASPTVDTTHSGSSHAGVQAAAEATAAAALATVTALDLLVGTATGVLSGEIVAGTTPQGELGGTWASPTVDTTHSGSSHASIQAAAEATAAAALTAHEADLSAAHSATGITFTPVGTIASTDVQAAIAEVAAEAGAASFAAAGFAQNLTTADDTLQEVFDRYDTPDRFAVDYAVTKTATSAEVRSGTPLFVKIDQVLDYTEGDTGSPYFINLGPASQVGLVPDGNWGGWVDDTTTSTRGFPIGVVTVMGAHEFEQDAALGAAGCTYIDFRTTKNVAGVDADITGVCCFMNNHVYMADDADIDWYFGRGNYVVGINNYGSLGFTSQPVFTVNNDTGGTLDGAANTDFYSGPIVMPGVTMANRWGMYVDDAVASYLAFGQIEAGGIIERQVGIQINELVTADDYNIPINYGDPDVAVQPLFRVDFDGQVVTGGIKGLNNILGIKPGTTSSGFMIVDAAATLFGPISGHTHTGSGNYLGFDLRETVTMNASGGGLGTGNSFGGLNVTTEVDFQTDANVIGSALISTTGTFKNVSAATGIDLGNLFAFLAAPTITADAAAVTVTNVYGLAAQPTFDVVGGGTLAVDTITGFTSGPTIEAGVTAANRIGLEINDATVAGTLTTQYGIHIASLTGGTTNYGIYNNSSSVLLGGLYGHFGSGGDLDIHSTLHATKGTIFVHDEVEQRPTDQTFTSTPNWLFWNNTYTMNMATAAIGSFVNIGPTVIMAQAGSGFGAVTPILVSPTVQNTGNVNLGLTFGVVVNPNLQANTNTGLDADFIGVSVAPTYAAGLSSGTITTGTAVNYRSTLAVGASQTVTDLTHVGIIDASGSGTLSGTQIGVDIPALAKGATNYGIRSLAATNILAALYGSTSSGGHLPLRTTTDATKGNIQLDNPTVRFAQSTYTHPSGNYTMVLADAAVTMDASGGGSFTGNQYIGYALGQTVTFEQVGILAGTSGFSAGNQWKNVSTEANNIGLITNFSASASIYRADTQSITASVADFWSGGTFDVVSGGTMTASSHTSFNVAALSVLASATVTTKTGLSVANATGAGAVTTQIGVDIAALTKGGTNIGIRNKSTTELGSSSQTVFGTAGTLTTFAGMADNVDIATGTTNGTCIATTISQKLAFFAATPVIQQANAAQAAVGTTAPAGGTGATAGAYDTAANRNTMITTVNSCVTLVNRLRTDLVTLGLIKGAA